MNVPKERNLNGCCYLLYWCLSFLLMTTQFDMPPVNRIIVVVVMTVVVTMGRGVVVVVRRGEGVCGDGDGLDTCVSGCNT